MSQPTITITGAKAAAAKRAGVDAICIPVAKTLGPEPRKTLAYRTLNRGPRIIDDGYATAEIQEPKNIHVRLVANVVKEACKRTNEKVGDGTATTGTLAGAFYHTADKRLGDGSSEFIAGGTSKEGANALRRRILESAKNVKELIRSDAYSKKITSEEELVHIATISVGGDKELGKIIAKMAWEVGVDGFIDVVEGYKGSIETEIIKGMRFPAKTAAKAFVNNPTRFEMVVKDAHVLLTNYALDNAADIAPTLSSLNTAGVSKIAIIAPSFSDSVLISMKAAAKDGYFIYPVHAPSLRTEQFEDLAVYFDTLFIDKNKGKKLRNTRLSDLGFVEKLVVKDVEAKEDAVATGGKGTLEETMTGLDENKQLTERISTKIKDRIEMLKGQLDNTKEDMFKKLMERRIASMGSAVGIIRVGDSTQASALDTKMKIEDAVYASRSALRSGYVEGGGLCLKNIADTLEDDDILKEGLYAPYNTIQSSVSGGILIGPDVIDPADATYYAVEHASQVVANLITVDTITPEEEEIGLGEGSMMLARAINEFVISNKQHLGQIKEGEAEMERDRMNGLNFDEIEKSDRG